MRRILERLGLWTDGFGSLTATSESVQAFDKFTAPDSHCIQRDEALTARPSEATSANFWRVQLEAIYRKRNPYKLQRVPEMLENWKGQEALLYRRVCLAYDLDCQFYACQSKWPEDADRRDWACREDAAAQLGPSDSIGLAEAPVRFPDRLTDRSQKAPFAFWYSKEIPLCTVIGPKDGLRTPSLGISPFARLSQRDSERWCPIDGEADEAAESEENWVPDCPNRAEQDQLRESSLAGKVMKSGGKAMLSELPMSPRQRSRTAQKVHHSQKDSEDVPLVNGRPLVGCKRVLPADDWPFKRRKATHSAVP
mmetsp:Transcript_66559/g.81479  ORF Transcript_66559/g.81479 Transcript_66559/m.81479 type:complete len:309 (-) Transcript_66559:194-1120(-)